MSVATALLALGGNVGDVEATMGAALRSLDARDDLRVVAVSRLYATPPWGKTDQADFVNACAAVETDLAPHALLDLCLATEKRHGRERGERWGPRTLDLDLIDYDGRIVEDERLHLPHPRAKDRAFVLTPLADLSSGIRLGAQSVAELLDRVSDDGIRVLRKDRSWWRSERPNAAGR